MGLGKGKEAQKQYEFNTTGNLDWDKTIRTLVSSYNVILLLA